MSYLERVFETDAEKVTIPNELTLAGGVKIPAGLVFEVSGLAGYQALIKTTAGTIIVIPANPTKSRAVIVMLSVTETFAAGSGAAPIFSIGETGATTKFVNAKNTGTSGDVVAVYGINTAGTDIIITATAATGNGAGAMTVTVISIPIG